MTILEYKTLRDEKFIQAVQKLGTHAFKDQKLAYGIAKLLVKIEKESKISQDLYSKLVNEHAEKDEKGELKPFENRPGTFAIEEGKVESWKKATEDLDKLTFEVQMNKVKLEQLEGVSLSAQDLMALEPILVEE